MKYLIWNEYTPDGPHIWGYVNNYEDIEQAIADYAEAFEFDPEQITYRYIDFVGKNEA